MVNLLINTSSLIIICFFLVNLLTRAYQILCTTPYVSEIIIYIYYRDFIISNLSSNLQTLTSNYYKNPCLCQVSYEFFV